jgi:hypothetical protein
VVDAGDVDRGGVDTGEVLAGVVDTGAVAVALVVAAEVWLGDVDATKPPVELAGLRDPASKKTPMADNRSPATVASVGPIGLRAGGAWPGAKVLINVDR